MSFRYPAGLITASSPVNANYPSGVWTPRQALPYLQNGVWGQDQYFDQTTLLLHGDGTNGAQNNTFLDGSSNNFTITRNGNTTQGTFSPFSLAAGEWSNYFDGTGDYLTVADNAAFEFGSGDFTIEGWIYMTAGSGAFRCITAKSNRNDGSGLGSFVIQISNTNKLQMLFANSTTGSVWNINVQGTTNVELNTWNHVAITRSGNTFTGWLNGSSEVTASNSITLADNAQVLTIGALGYTSGTFVSLFTGYISNLRLVKGRAVYTSAFTPPTAPLGATSGGTNPPQGTETSLLTCQSNRFVDNGGLVTPNTITPNGDVRVTPFSPFAPSAAYSAGTNGGSGYFDGTGDNLTVANNAAFQLGSGDFTIEFWAYFNSVAVGHTPLSMWATNQYQFSFYTSSAGVLSYYLSSNGTTWGIANGVSCGSISANQWIHVALVRSGSTFTPYINGVAGTTTTSASALHNSTAAVSAGSGSSVDYFNGYLSNVRIVKGTAITPPVGGPTAPLTPITNTSLLLNFTNAGIFDNTGKNNLETVGNAQIDTTTKKFGTGSMEFDGTDDRIFTPSSVDLIMGTGNFTIEGWFYANSTSNKGIFQLSSTTGGLDPSAATANIAFALQTNGYSVYAANVGTTITSVVPSTSTWTHFAVVRSSGVTRLYINGSQAGSNITDTTNYAGGNLVVGGYYSTSFLFNGFIDDLRITKGVARYTANFVPPIARFPNQ